MEIQGVAKADVNAPVAPLAAGQVRDGGSVHNMLRYSRVLLSCDLAVRCSIVSQRRKLLQQAHPMLLGLQVMRCGWEVALTQSCVLQVAVAVLYIACIGLWLYAEQVERLRK